MNEFGTMEGVTPLHTPASAQRHSHWMVWHSLSLLSILLGISLVEWLMPHSMRVTAWLTILLLMALFALIAGHGVTGTWLGVLTDTRNKVSLSRLQMTLWTVLILSGFLTAVLANLSAGVLEPLAITVPPELWLLMGISTASMVGSPLILSVKRHRPSNEEDKQQALNKLARRDVDPSQVNFRGQLVENRSIDAARIADLFQGSETGNVGLLDMGKLQMFFFTLVLLFAYGTALAGAFSSGETVSALPALDGGMLALLGISHAGYLVNKALPHSSSD
jgi:hypothetical protein